MLKFIKSFFGFKGAEPAPTAAAAPYKVEAPEPVVLAPVLVQDTKTEVSAPAVEVVASKPAKPAKKEPAPKKAAPAKKKPAAMKAPAKPKASKKPKAK